MKPLLAKAMTGQLGVFRRRQAVTAGYTEADVKRLTAEVTGSRSATASTRPASDTRRQPARRVPRIC